MATQTIKMKIQFRRDTAANWEQFGHLAPAAGEPCFVIDKNILKIGDGVTPFNDLVPINGVQLDVDGKSLVLEDGVLKLAGFDAADIGAQPRKTENGIEWVVPSTETVDGLKTAVSGLQTDVASLKNIVGTVEEGAGTLLERISALETGVDVLNGDVGVEGSVLKIVNDAINKFASDISADETVNTFKELIDYVAEHGPEAANMAADIKSLRDLVGTTPVSDQIMAIVNASGHMAEKKAAAVFEHVKYEFTDVPVGTLVDYKENEIRVMVPANAQFAKQAVGAGGDANSYYATFKTYAPNDKVVGYIEHLGDKVDSEILTSFSIDEYGRRYQPTWLALAKYDEATGNWNYYGKTSTVHEYIGWDYRIDWYDADGIMVASDCIRINLSNEDCHHNIEPYYMSKVVKEVAVNGETVNVVNGKVDIAVPQFKGSDEIEVAEDGTLRIKSISFDKIAQDEDQEIILSGGGAAG